MTMRAYLETAKRSEKRSTARKTLRLSAPGQQAGRQATNVLIRDLSAGGMLVESDTRLKVGEKISVELPHHGASDASIVWVSGRFYGCRFAKPLSSAAVSAALLKSQPEDPEWAGVEESAPAILTGFAEKLTALREARGLSIEQLAKRLSISRQALWYWETGKRAPRRTFLKRLADELGVRGEDLAGSGPVEATSSILDTCKEQVAAKCGVTVDQVKIVVEF